MKCNRMNIAKRPIPRYDFKVLGEAVKITWIEHKEGRKKVSAEMFISTHCGMSVKNILLISVQTLGMERNEYIGGWERMVQIKFRVTLKV